MPINRLLANVPLCFEDSSCSETRNNKGLELFEDKLIKIYARDYHKHGFILNNFLLFIKIQPLFYVLHFSPVKVNL